jgi:hypothetical protein
MEPAAKVQMLNTKFSFALLIGLFIQPTPTFAQLKTIPAMLAEQGADLTSGASVPISSQYFLITRSSSQRFSST